MYKFLTVYGPTGFTSFWSIKREIEPFRILDARTHQPKTKETLNIVISSVAGGIGLTVAEYLSKLGYQRIFGIAGSEEKCAVAKKLGCRGVINYKKYYDNETIRAREFEKAVREMMGGETCDLYYENVGEDMLSSMLNLMTDNGKVIMCGATATYNNWGSKEGVRNFENIISKRIQLKGILYFDEDFNERIKVFMEMGSLDMEGCDLVIPGIEALPTTYRNMIHGKFIGKPVVKLCPELTFTVPE
jgi:NADPH-dependent curcumin reductase